ncbi:hypothetical protein LINPERHAP1_LOCUS3290 [Linum perenne]
MSGNPTMRGGGLWYRWFT